MTHPPGKMLLLRTVPIGFARLCIGFLFFSCCLNAQPSRYVFRSLPNDSGFAIAAQHTLLQDSRGFLWVGTFTGLYRYDGYQFKPYQRGPTPEDNAWLSLVNYVYEDRAGDLWVGSPVGLDRLNRKTGRFQRYTHDSSVSTSLIDDNVTGILESRNGNLWIGTGGGLDLFDRTSGVFTHFLHDSANPNSLSQNWTTALLEDRTGSLWLGHGDAGLDSYDSRDGSFRHYRHDSTDPGSLAQNHVISLCETSDGALWVGTWGGGLDRLDPATGRFTHFRHKEGSPDGLSDNTINTLLQSGDGTLWVGTEQGGLCWSRQADGVFHRVTPDPFGSSAFAPANVTALCEDKSGNLLVGSYRGIRYLDTRRPKIACEIPQPEGRGGPLVRSLLQDTQRRLWVGGSGGLSCFDPSKQTWRHFRQLPGDRNTPTDSWIDGLCEDSLGTVWIACSAGGLYGLPGGAGNFLHYRHDPADSASLRSSDASSVCIDRSGVIWVGGGSGVLEEFDRSTGRFRHHWRGQANGQNPSGCSITAVCGDRSGIIWTGYYWDGLDAYDVARDTFTHYANDSSDSGSLASNFVTELTEDSRGDIWIRLMGGGLDRLNRKTGSFEHFIPNSKTLLGAFGPPVEDRRGMLWVSMGLGVWCVDPETRTEQNYYLAEEKDLDATGRIPGKAPLGNNGLILFTLRGLVSIYPDSIRRAPQTHPVAITGFRVFDKALDVDSAVAEAGEIRLAYSDNAISIDFAVLDFVDPQRNRYACMLEGLDRDWVKFDTRHYAGYAHLDPGEYVFRVKGRSADGLWNERGASLRIMIVPPFWRTWWFTVLLWVFALGGIGAAFRVLENRRVRLRTRALEEQHALQRERLRISSDLHDELASNLTSIAMLSRIVRDEPAGMQGEEQSGVQHRHMLERITTLAQESVDSIRDIIWAIDPKAESLAGLLGRLRDMLVALCRAKNIHAHIELPPEDLLPQGNLAPEARQHLWFLLKEAISNAVKHSGGSELWLCVEFREGEMRAMVRDNGRGFVAAAPTSGKGRATMRMRAEKLGARLEQESAPGAGTSVTVALRLPA